jgi:hypothetical protein
MVLNCSPVIVLESNISICDCMDTGSLDNAFLYVCSHPSDTCSVFLHELICDPHVSYSGDTVPDLEESIYNIVSASPDCSE